MAPSPTFLPLRPKSSALNSKTVLPTLNNMSMMSDMPVAAMGTYSGAITAFRGEYFEPSFLTAPGS